jgi:hypothetical protein
MTVFSNRVGSRSPGMERINQLGIFREHYLKYVVPVLSERVGIVLGYRYKNIKHISSKFNCTITFQSMNTTIKCGTYQPVYKLNYPIFIIKSENELNIWDTINYIHDIVSLPPQKIECRYGKPQCCDNCIYWCTKYHWLKKATLKHNDPENKMSDEYRKNECYCGDPFGDTFDQCYICNEREYIRGIERKLE